MLYVSRYHSFYILPCVLTISFLPNSIMSFQIYFRLKNRSNDVINTKLETVYFLVFKNYDAMVVTYVCMIANNTCKMNRNCNR